MATPISTVARPLEPWKALIPQLVPGVAAGLVFGVLNPTDD